MYLPSGLNWVVRKWTVTWMRQSLGELDNQSRGMRRTWSGAKMKSQCRASERSVGSRDRKRTGFSSPDLYKLYTITSHNLSHFTHIWLSS
jgi:hypothetical protein